MSGPDFAILGLPRSGTTWAANWLSDGSAICLHDPEQDHAPEDILRLNLGRSFGISSSGLWAWPDVIARLECPVLILDRDPGESDASMQRLGLDPLPSWAHDRFAGIKGLRVPHEWLWRVGGARAIWNYLRAGKEFDVLRWRELARVRVEPVIEKIRLCDGTRAAMRSIQQGV
ncbi:MAG TPA: hypothetical protein VJ673_02670 [Aromatoleum sp.]|uniref:hypothetical protein n=1 Tax=Aromatoleum sp. TaxID=2307007 RepID=UPI002B488D26|nr:hypothetical protein [Aromatoleum sp.]HJV24556.1 hypothetical protein [Aromatoleum sp.]